MEKRNGIGGSAERSRPGRVRAEEDLLEDIRYCDEVLDHDTITDEDAAKFSEMRKSNLFMRTDAYRNLPLRGMRPAPGTNKFVSNFTL